MTESWFPLLCYFLVFADLLSADIPYKLLKRVPGLLGGHITPRSILGRYYTPFPLLPSHPHPLPDLGPGSWPTSSTISFQEMNDFLKHTSLISKTCELCFLQHTSSYLTAYSIWGSVSIQSSSRMPIFLLAYQQCVMKVGTSWFLYPAVKRIFLFFFIFVLFHFILLGRFVFSFSVPMKRFSAMMRHDGNRDYWCFITQRVFQNEEFASKLKRRLKNERTWPVYNVLVVGKNLASFVERWVLYILYSEVHVF